MSLTIEQIKEKLEFFKNKSFIFDEESHTYTYNNEIMYGTTSFLSRFVKPFDSDYWSKKKAEEEGITQKEMLERWDAKRDRSCDLGHTVHSWIENFYELNETKLTDDKEANERIEKFKIIYDKELSKLESIGSEIKVFSTKWNIAGTIDKLYYYKGSVIIGDWKTNQKIKTDSDFCFGKLLAPFEYLKDNELNKYSMQLSIYALLLEEIGIDVDYTFICHIPTGDDEAKIYKCKNLKTEMKSYLNNNLFLTGFNINKDDEKVVESIKKDIKIEKIW